MHADPGRLSALAATALELHGTLRELDPARFVAERAPALHDSLARAAGVLRTDPGAPSGEPRESGASPSDGVAPAAQALAAALSSPPAADEVDVGAWVAFRVAVGPAYEDLVAALARSGQRVPSLRPTNYARNIFHVCSGLFALAVIELWTERMLWVAGGFLTSAVLMESSRRVSPRANEVLMGAFGKVAHPYERHRVNSASWYALALVLLALFVPPVGCAVGVVVLGFGDPWAAIIGRRFGRTKLPGGRSLEGSLAFVVAGGLPSLAVLLAAHGLPLQAALGVAMAGATAGAAAEVLSGPLDDNFTIPLVGGLAAWGAATLLT